MHGHDMAQPHTEQHAATKRSGVLPTCYTWTDPKHMVLSETPDTGGHMVCDPISVKCPEQADPHRCGFVGAGG